jgi:hypothetical protein
LLPIDRVDFTPAAGCAIARVGNCLAGFFVTTEHGNLAILCFYIAKHIGHVTMPDREASAQGSQPLFKITQAVDNETLMYRIEGVRLHQSRLEHKEAEDRSARV